MPRGTYAVQVVADSSSSYGGMSNKAGASARQLAMLVVVDASGMLLVASSELVLLARLECEAWTIRAEPFQASAGANAVKVLHQPNKGLNPACGRLRSFTGLHVFHCN